MTHKPFFSIVIVSYNSAPFINSCLKSIYASSFKDFEIIIVDNYSQDDTLKIIKPSYLRRTNLKLISLKQNIGSAAGRNLGAKQARGQFLLFLDPDTEMAPDCLKQYRHFTQLYPQFGAAQAKLLNLQRQQYFDSAGEYLDALGFLVDRASGAKDTGQLDFTAPILAGKTACVLVNHQAFQAIGGFDKTYFFLLEDADLFWRLWLNGYLVLFYPQAKVYHAFNTPAKNLRHAVHYSGSLIQYRGSRNYLFTLLKNLGPKKLLTIVPLHCLVWLSVATIFVLKLQLQQSLAIIKGLFWNLFHLGFVWKKRAQVQRKRRLSDEELDFLFCPPPPLSLYLKKIFSYVQT
jgi:N-acetylglucosaminyl-diphospho-decaprenol L-rhamnosyltransferase